MRDSYGTAWYVDGPNGARVPVDVEKEFAGDWLGHHAETDDGETTA